MLKTRLIVTALTLILSFTILAGCSTPQRQFARAERLEQSGKPAEALIIYQKMLDQIPAANPRARSQVYYRMGESLYRLERIPDAYAAYQRAADIEPGNLAAHLRVGELLLSAGAPDRAREQAELVLKSNAGNTEAVALLGGALA